MKTLVRCLWFDEYVRSRAVLQVNNTRIEVSDLTERETVLQFGTSILRAHCMTATLMRLKGEKIIGFGVAQSGNEPLKNSAPQNSAPLRPRSANLERME